MLKEVIVQESRAEEIETSYDGMTYHKYFFSKDNLNLFFSCNFEEIPEREKFELKKSILNTCNELTRLNDVHMFNIEISKVLNKMKFLTFSAESLTQQLRQLLNKMISDRKQSREEFYRKLSIKIEEKFHDNSIYSNYEDSYYNYKDKDLESKIKRLLENITNFNSENVIAKLKNGLEYNLNLKEELKVDDIVAKRFNQYCESKKKEDILNVLNDIITDIGRYTRVKNIAKGIWKNISLETKKK